MCLLADFIGVKIRIVASREDIEGPATRRIAALPPLNNIQPSSKSKSSRDPCLNGPAAILDVRFTLESVAKGDRTAPMVSRRVSDRVQFGVLS
jgi:hypothetical protein